MAKKQTQQLRTIRLSLDAKPSLHFTVAKLATDLDCSQREVLRRAIVMLEQIVRLRSLRTGDNRLAIVDKTDRAVSEVLVAL